MNPDQNPATAATARTPKSLADKLFKETPEAYSFSYSPQTKRAVVSMPKFLAFIATLLTLTFPMSTPAIGFDLNPPTGTIVSAVLNDASSLTVTLNANAHDPGIVCAQIFPFVCGNLEITLSYDGMTWTPWQQANTTKQYSITMVGQQQTVYARLRNSSWSESSLLSAPVQIPGRCGSDNGQTLATMAPTALCGIGTPSLISGSGHPWSWSCQGDAGTTPASCSATVQTFDLSVTVAGIGKGDVAADVLSNDASPKSIFCPTSFCSALFDYGRIVRLTAIPDSVSLFSSWDGACSGDPCDIEMKGPKTVTANFSRPHGFNNVTKGIFDSSLATIMLSATTGDEIRILATYLNINSQILNKALTLTGGWNALYLAPAATATTLNGTLTIQEADVVVKEATVKGNLSVQSGSLKVNRVLLRP